MNLIKRVFARDRICRRKFYGKSSFWYINKIDLIVVHVGVGSVPRKQNYRIFFHVLRTVCSREFAYKFWLQGANRKTNFLRGNHVFRKGLFERSNLSRDRVVVRLRYYIVVITTSDRNQKRCRITEPFYHDFTILSLSLSLHRSFISMLIHIS